MALLSADVDLHTQHAIQRFQPLPTIDVRGSILRSGSKDILFEYFAHY